jgi:uncharacterized lipoprotein YddW (UPF0748 family)
MGSYVILDHRSPSVFMSDRVLSSGLRRGLFAAASALLLLHGPGLRAEPAAGEVRALWVVRTTLSSPAAIETMVGAARAAGFNTLLVQVRGRADAYYAGGIEPRPVALVSQPAFDPLAETISRAHAAGLKVHAWVNVNLISSAAELPLARDHVVYRHPEWLMVPRQLAADLVRVDPKSPEYLGRLARFARGQANELEGLYLSPVTQPAVDYTVGIIRDIVQRYAVDGVHLDYARYPRYDFDYSRDALAAFRRSVVGDLDPADTAAYDRRLGTEPLIYTQAFPDRWRRFRAAQLTALVARLGAAVKEARPQALVSAAVMPDLEDASTNRFQDWRTWLERGVIDVVCPMAYTTDAAVFATQVATAREAAGPHPLWAGIGAYRLSQLEIVANVQAARRLGAGGIVLFSYDSLTGPTRGTEYLAQVGRAAFMP